MRAVNAEMLLSAQRKYYSKIMDELHKSTPGIAELDHWRHQLPLTLAKRYEETKDISITHDELKKLMEWKLKKGKFRPTLKKLIAENDPETVVEVSREASQLILDSKHDLDEEEYVKLIKASINVMTKLRGVGPATASLILSLLNHITRLAPPFYSDEAAQYIFRHNDGPEKLKYSLSEYIKFLRVFYQFNPEFKLDFSELETGAWSLELKDLYGIEDRDEARPDKKRENSTKEERTEDTMTPNKKRKSLKEIEPSV